MKFAIWKSGEWKSSRRLELWFTVACLTRFPILKSRNAKLKSSNWWHGDWPARKSPASLGILKEQLKQKKIRTEKIQNQKFSPAWNLTLVVCFFFRASLLILNFFFRIMLSICIWALAKSIMSYRLWMYASLSGLQYLCLQAWWESFKARWRREAGIGAEYPGRLTVGTAFSSCLLPVGNCKIC